jgi:hypothetical protein
MKITGKIFVGMLLVALLLLPMQAAQAKGLDAGPIFGSNFTLKSGDTLNEDLVVFGGSVTIEKNATVNGAVVLLGGSLTLDGEVSKDVVVFGGAVRLGAETHIHGNLVTFGAPVDRETGAKVDGNVVNNPTAPAAPASPVVPVAPVTPANPTIPLAITSAANPFWNMLGVLGQSIMLALLAVLITMFLPNQMRRVADGVVAQPFVTFGMGLLTLIMFIVAMVALALFSLFIITLIVTVPLIVIIAVIFASAVVLGWLALGMEVGVRIAQMFKGEWPLPLAAGLGVFALNLVAQGIGFIPCIGWALSTILGFAGLGAVFMTRFGTRGAMLTPVVMTDASAPTS